MGQLECGGVHRNERTPNFHFSHSSACDSVKFAAPYFALYALLYAVPSFMRAWMMLWKTVSWQALRITWRFMA